MSSDDISPFPPFFFSLRTRVLRFRTVLSNLKLAKKNNVCRSFCHNIYNTDRLESHNDDNSTYVEYICAASTTGNTKTLLYTLRIKPCYLENLCCCCCLDTWLSSLHVSPFLRTRVMALQSNSLGWREESDNMCQGDLRGNHRGSPSLCLELHVTYGPGRQYIY